MVDLQPFLQHRLEGTALPWPRKQGKVRDIYDLGDTLALVATDRMSGFDRALCAIPLKGQVLNLTSAWWFQNTASICPNHLLSVPDPNVTIARKCQPFPVEFVVRGYLTGSTSTSLWTHYQRGAREYCGNKFPDGLIKNQILPQAILTPTTKDLEDRPVSPREIIAEGRMKPDQLEQVAALSLALFQQGQAIARQRGLILVDTKYEFGLDPAGTIRLLDELHTPDSSRYWIAESYQERFSAGREPENIDKEFLRLWFKERCDPYRDPELPEPPQELILETTRRYVLLYEKITGQSFPYPDPRNPIAGRIEASLSRTLQKH